MLSLWQVSSSCTNSSCTSSSCTNNSYTNSSCTNSSCTSYSCTSSTRDTNSASFDSLAWTLTFPERGHAYHLLAHRCNKKSPHPLQYKILLKLLFKTDLIMFLCICKQAFVLHSPSSIIQCSCTTHQIPKLIHILQHSYTNSVLQQHSCTNLGFPYIGTFMGKYERSFCSKCCLNTST